MRKKWFEKLEFFIIMDGQAPENERHWQESLTEAYINGLEPIEYQKDTLVDEKNVVAEVVLLRVKERWTGAAKRFIRKAGLTRFNQDHEGLLVFR